MREGKVQGKVQDMERVRKKRCTRSLIFLSLTTIADSNSSILDRISADCFFNSSRSFSQLSESSFCEDSACRNFDRSSSIYSPQCHGRERITQRGQRYNNEKEE